MFNCAQEDSTGAGGRRSPQHCGSQNISAEGKQHGNIVRYVEDSTTRTSLPGTFLITSRLRLGGDVNEASLKTWRLFDTQAANAASATQHRSAVELQNLHPRNCKGTPDRNRLLEVEWPEIYFFNTRGHQPPLPWPHSRLLTVNTPGGTEATTNVPSQQVLEDRGSCLVEADLEQYRPEVWQVNDHLYELFPILLTARLPEVDIVLFHGPTLDEKNSKEAYWQNWMNNNGQSFVQFMMDDFSNYRISCSVL
ncbi:hypothetical protein R1flu_017009 [Riccia fluitans]|uniref:Uncharacterized protein n=1 Tax=Riccia fluitans TaxID=41844 RepID=A0ABD1YNR1_9MARC